MATRGQAGDPVVWPCLIKTIWARRLAPLALRESGERRLTEAWSAAAAEAFSHSWELDGIVPLLPDPHGHHWAVVVSRVAPTADMVLVHGTTPLEALENTRHELASLTR